MRAFLAVGIVCLAAAASRADVIVLADDARVEGKLVEADATSVRFTTKDGQPVTRARKDVAAVLFFDAAKDGARPAASIFDHVEMDGLSLDGTLLRFARKPFGPFGMTNAVLVDAAGKLVPVATPRRIASISFGTWKAPPPVKPAKGAKPVKPAPPPKAAGPAEALAATEKALAAAKPENDVPALLFAAETVSALQTDDAAKTRLATEIETARGLLPEHMKRCLVLGDVKVEVVDFSEMVVPSDAGLPPGVKIPPIKRPSGPKGSDPDADEGGGPGIYVFAHLLSTTGELPGATVRYYWRSKDGRAGFEDKDYFTKKSAADNAVAIGLSWRGHELERVAVQIRFGERVLDTKEVGVPGSKAPAGAWWDAVKERDWPKHFVTHKDGGRESGRVTDTFWERMPFEDGQVDDPDDK